MKVITYFMLTLGVGVAAMTGCGGDCDAQDLACRVVEPEIDSGNIYRLDSGDYNIAERRDEADGCMINGDPQHPLQGMSLFLSSDPMGNVELRKYGQGQMRNNAAVLFNSGSAWSGDCTYDYKMRIELRLTGDNQLTARYVEDQMNRLMTCVPAIGMNCRTALVMELRKE